MDQPKETKNESSGTRPADISRGELMHQMDATLSEEELRTLCFELGEDYDNLGGRGKRANARELIAYLERHGRYQEGVAAFQRLRLGLSERPSIDKAGKLRAELAHQRLAQMPTNFIPGAAQLPLHSWMPFHSNPFFVGREAELSRLASTLKGDETISRSPIAAVTGLGGIGKTQLAIEFAHRYGEFFAGGVFWLSFAEAADVAAEVAACGRVGIADLRPDFHELPLDEQVRLVRATWQSEIPRLLIFDNCEEESLLEAWRPASGSSRILITSRRAVWSSTLGVQVFSLGVLDRAKSSALLAKYRPDLLTNTDLSVVAERLGDLPLALHLAGSYLKRYQHSESLGNLSYYLKQLDRADLLEHLSMQGQGAERSPTAHDQHVARTIALSYEQLDEEDEVDALSLALVARAAYLAPGELIPRELLMATLNPPYNDEPMLVRAEEGLWRLVALGLVEQEASGMLVLHRLVAAFVRYRMTAQSIAMIVEQTLLAKAEQLNEAGYPASLRLWQSHLRYVTEAALERASPLAAALCSQLSEHLFSQGDYSAARGYAERALRLREQIVGFGHAERASSLNHLGRLVARQGDYDKARLYLEEALTLREQLLGPTHPDTASSLHHLGRLLARQADYIGARPYLERALVIRHQVLGPMHSDTAATLNHLGRLLARQRDYEGAQVYLEQALLIREQVLGLNHPDTAATLNHLGFLLLCEKRYEEAQSYLERALAIREQVLGPAHPDTAWSFNDLGFLHVQQEQYTAARPYLERAVAIREQVLGPLHPYTAWSLNDLGFLLTQQGHFVEARSYLERALAIREQVLEPLHPDVAQSLSNLGALWYTQGEYHIARSYLGRAMTIVERIYGPTHLDQSASDSQQLQATIAYLVPLLRGFSS